MIPFWYIPPEGFTKDRAIRIGASDIAKMIPDPENPVESLAGYEQTALTLWQEKSGLKKRDPAGLAAEMGNYLENKALELFIRRFSGYDAGRDFRESKVEYEYERYIKSSKTANSYQYTDYKHNTQFYNDAMIAHPDCVYVPDGIPDGFKYDIDYKVKREGITVDLSKPFLIEAKSAQFFAAKRRENTLVKGFDFSLTTWHGIPLKHYVQIQFQLALFQIPVAYLALIYDTSKFQIWRIDANEKWQARIIDLAGKMHKHIISKTMPRELAMNADDVKIMYPRIEKDYVMLSGESLDNVKDLCKEYQKAGQQEKNWKAKKKDAQDALAVMLRDYGELREGSDILAKWNLRKGSMGIGKPEGIEESKDSFIVWLKKNDLNTYKYLERKGFIKKSADSRNVGVKFKEE